MILGVNFSAVTVVTVRLLQAGVVGGSPPSRRGALPRVHQEGAPARVDEHSRASGLWKMLPAGEEAPRSFRETGGDQLLPGCSPPSWGERLNAGRGGSPLGPSDSSPGCQLGEGSGNQSSGKSIVERWWASRSAQQAASVLHGGRGCGRHPWALRGPLAHWGSHSEGGHTQI